MNQNCTTKSLFIFFILTVFSFGGFTQCNADAGPNVNFCTGYSIRHRAGIYYHRCYQSPGKQ